jgi:Cys-tRNA(Pro)/Cys-tRNA(Cys) deacylase
MTVINETPPASLALEKLGIPHKVFRHTGQVSSLEQAAQERGQRPGQVVRSILFRLGEGEFIMALVAGPAQISWKRLRKHLGQSRLTMATEDEVLAVTGYRVGTVSPFGLPEPVKVLIDQGILKEEEVSIGSGIRNVGIVIGTADLRRAIKDTEIVQLVENT